MNVPHVDYRHSPHLAQWALFDRLVSITLRTLRTVADAGLPLRVLEIGAGHGSYTGPMLAAGCEVTLVEMSRASHESLQARYATNERLTTIHDPGADLTDVGRGYSLVVVISVLHHIPDYMEFLERITDRVTPGGAVLLLQEPLWYPRVARFSRMVDRGAYLVWRLGQRNVREGIKSMRRRFLGIPLEAKPGEIIYYHVVRQGVDEEAICHFLDRRFTSVESMRYWAHHLAAIRRPAELAGLTNTFAVRATGCTR